MSPGRSISDDEVRLNCNGDGSRPPLPLGEGWGEGFRSLDSRAPSPGLHWTMLRVARSNPTSPQRGEVDELVGQIDSTKLHPTPVDTPTRSRDAFAPECCRQFGPR